MSTSRGFSTLASWLSRRADAPEMLVMTGGVTLALCFGLYTFKRTVLNTRNGSAFIDIDTRGDMWRQSEGTTADRSSSMWWRLAQFKVDEQGYRIGVFNNRVRPFQYEKVSGLDHSGALSTSQQAG